MARHIRLGTPPLHFPMYTLNLPNVTTHDRIYQVSLHTAAVMDWRWQKEAIAGMDCYIPGTLTVL